MQTIPAGEPYQSGSTDGVDGADGPAFAEGEHKAWNVQSARRRVI